MGGPGGTGDFEAAAGGTRFGGAREPLREKQQYFLYQHFKDFRELSDAQLVMGDDQSGRWKQSENLFKWLNKVSEEALDVTTLAAAPEVEIRALAACFAKYQELLHENNSLDFSGIQYEALQLLEKRPEVLEQLRERLTHLMVDEYQDTNTIQERILLLLAGQKKNLCVVGDDDQGLYRFRGATIRNILEFLALFDDGQCKQVNLTVNYRSHPDIIRFYNEWMREQTWEDGMRVFRFAKQIVPREDDFPDMPTAVRLRKHFEVREKALAKGQALGINRYDMVAWKELTQPYNLMLTTQGG